MTKQQRKEIYWAAMFRVHEVGLCGEGLCYLLNMMPEFAGKYYFDVDKDFPELWQQKPKAPYSGIFWFKPGAFKLARLECLSKAIDLCEE